MNELQKSGLGAKAWRFVSRGCFAVLTISTCEPNRPLELIMTLPREGNPEVVAVLTQKKKTRLNPTRRKAAAKANAEAHRGGNGASDAKAAKISHTQSPPTGLTSQRSQQRPAPLSRQNTAPLSTARRPGLARAMTAPALVTGGLVGCAAGAAILLGVGLWYDFEGAESAILTAKAAKLCVDNLTEEIITSLQAGTYSADEALDMLRRTTLAYASTIPEGAPFVERIFREVDMVRKQRGREVDKIVAETYDELLRAGRNGATQTEMRSIVVSQLIRLSTFASRATQDVIARNPSLRPCRGGPVEPTHGSTDWKVPTVRLNMAVRQKQAANA